MAKVIELRDVKAGPGTWSYGRLPITTLASGMELGLPLHILNGREDGPRLCLVSTSHGNEVFSIGLLKSILEAVDLSKLRGALVAIPVANPLALDAGTRNTPYDLLDLNRLFPGNLQGSLSEMIASALAEIVELVDCLIDYHCGSVELITNHVLLQDLPGTYGAQVRSLSQAYGLEILHLSEGYQGTLTGYAAEKKVPAVVVEIGGGTALTTSFVETAKRGVFNIMKVLGMLAGEPEVPVTQLLIRDMAMIRAPQGGLFYPQVGLEQIGQVVTRGMPLGRIFSPLSLRELETLTAPFAETLLILIRTALSRVQPGDFAYFVGDMATSERILWRESSSLTTIGE